MNHLLKFSFLACLLPLCNLAAIEASPKKINALYCSLDPLSISQHLALYELYPESEEGKKALNDAWKLIGLKSGGSLPACPQTIHAINALIQRLPDQKASQISEEALTAIERAAASLGNRKLKGYYSKTEEEVLALPPEEIDLARAIFLSQRDQDSEAAKGKRGYEAAIDLMALQIKARLPSNATPEKKIRTINDFIFHELGFRFPPQSLYAKEVDRYTFLSSVIDSRRGICLGVSVLYLALAQRLELKLEIVTPPGHIYVRHRDGDKIINIETTARGVDIDSEDYLSVDTFALQERNLKETVGLVHFNQAADSLRDEAFDQSLEAYEKARLYMPNDCLLDELMGACHVLCGNMEEGKALLRKAVDSPSAYQVCKNNSPEDYLCGFADAQALRVLFMHVDETRDSILAKQKCLEEVVQKYPKFRAGLFAMAMTWIQLHRFGQALEYLERYHELDATDPKVEYYLAALYAERFNLPKAWEHLKTAETITKASGHSPKALKDLRKALSQQCPE